MRDELLEKGININPKNKKKLPLYWYAVQLSNNIGDISKIPELPYADMWTYSFPCQSISLAGRREGIIKGVTRSGLLYEVQRLLEKARDNSTPPEYLILENVKNLVGKQFKVQFLDWCGYLDSLGYNTYWQIMDAKDYGIPQHRERVFAVSIRKDIDDKTFTFPEKIPLTICVKDFLEDKVDEKYYLKEDTIRYLEGYNRYQEEKGNGFRFEPIDTGGVTKTLTSAANLRTDTPTVKEAVKVTKKGNTVGQITDVSNTLMARDYKGFGNYEMTGVIEDDATDNQH